MEVDLPRFPSFARAGQLDWKPGLFFVPSNSAAVSVCVPITWRSDIHNHHGRHEQQQQERWEWWLRAAGKDIPAANRGRIPRTTGAVVQQQLIHIQHTRLQPSDKHGIHNPQQYGPPGDAGERQGGRAGRTGHTAAEPGARPEAPLQGLPAAHDGLDQAALVDELGLETQHQVRRRKVRAS